MWSELVRSSDVQNKAHRIVLGQDGYCQGILRTGKLRLSLRDCACSKMGCKGGTVPKWFGRGEEINVDFTLHHAGTTVSKLRLRAE